MKASVTLTVRVRLRRVWPALWWIRLAARLVRFGLTVERTAIIGNRLLALATVECRATDGRLLSRQAFPGRMTVERGDQLRWPHED